MNIIIGGAGEVGFNLIENLQRKDIQILVIDTDKEILNLVESMENVKTICGSITDSQLINKKQLKKVDLFIAITNFDETNIIACQMAKAARVKKTICRIRHMGYDTFDRKFSLTSLGIDWIINPVAVVSNELFRLVLAPNSVDNHDFFQNKITLIGFQNRTFSNFNAKRVGDINKKLTENHFSIATIHRGERTFIPRSDFVIEPHDIIYFFSPINSIPKLKKILGYQDKITKNIFINGGGQVGFSLASKLEKTPHRLKVIEKNLEQCKKITNRLQKSMVLNFDGTDSKTLESEGIRDADFFIAVTDNDPVNITSAMIASELSVKYPISLVKQPEYISIIEKQTPIYLGVSPRLLSARFLSRFIHGKYVSAFFSILNTSTEIIEIKIPETFQHFETGIGDTDFPADMSIGLIYRSGNILTPRPEIKFKCNDLLIIILHKFDRPFVLDYFHSVQ